MKTLGDNTVYLESGCDSNYFNLIECANCGTELRADDMIQDPNHHLLDFCSEECQTNYWAGRAEHLKDMEEER